MTHRLMLVPAGGKINLSEAAAILKKLLEAQKARVALFEPVSKQAKNGLSFEAAEDFLAKGSHSDLLREIEKHYQSLAQTDVVLIQGLDYSSGHAYALTLNKEISTSLDTTVVIVPGVATDKQIEVALHTYRHLETAVMTSVDQDWIKSWLAEPHERRLTPAIFSYRLIEKARIANKRIVLPEGAEPRTLRAVEICAKRGIAHCVLIGKADEIHEAAKRRHVMLPNEFEIIEPTAQTIEKYVELMVQLRKHKGLTQEAARKKLQDTVVLGIMMLQQGEVDGLVSGAVHTTASTIRPALQLIKVSKETQLVSSIFFMCLPNQVLVFGDCAINTNPLAAKLADIAIQSADSAASFDIEPRVAFISYSTGNSGQGRDVEKVKEALQIAKQKRPDLLMDGPLQYDTALIESIGRSKAPNSPVAGCATVLIFPDLNTGNAVYKAVQRSANIIAMGPMLQGLRKPVNDLSRGCLVDDIVFTIALTAIQAGQK